MRTPLLCAAALALSLAIPSGALALVSDGAPAQPDLIGAPPFAVSAESVDPAALAAAEARLASFGRTTGTHWQGVSWAPVSLTPGLAIGTGLDLGSPIPDQNAAVEAAREFVNAHPDLFRVEGVRLGTPRVRFGLGKWSVQWPEQIGGIPILHSRVEVLLTQSGRVAAFGATTYPTITRVAQPALSPAAAREIARAHLAQMRLLPLDATMRREQVRGPFVLPLLRGARGGVNEGESAPVSIEGRTILRVSLVSKAPPAAYEVDVDAVTGEVLQRTNILWSDFSGTVDASIEVPNWCAGFSDHPVPNLRIQVAHAGSGVTGPAGDFLIPSQLAAPESLTAALAGPFAQVQNQEGNNAFMRALIQPGVPLALRWDDSNSLPAERDAFWAANQMHDLIKTCDPGWTDLDYPVPLEVNYNDRCNAFWAESTATFFHQVDNCANTSREIDVVAHEYTHGVTWFMYGENQPPSDLHEGNSDVGGFLLSNNPKEAIGFYLDDCVNGIRNADNNLRWPQDVVGDGHTDGQIMSGFWWHSRQAMIQELGYDVGAATALATWHFARELGLPQRQPEEIWWSFLADDDDGNLDNGTPHYDSLVQSARRHGFPYPERFDNVVVHHEQVYCETSPHGEPIPLDAVIYSFAGPVNPDSLLAFYCPLGQQTIQSVRFLPTGGQNQYEAMLPGGWQGGSNVEYWIQASDMQGHRLRVPATGAYDFVVGFSCDDFEGATQWTLGVPGDNAPSYEKWGLMDPDGRSLPDYGWISPPLDTTPDPGHICWVTGGGIQSLRGTTTIASPFYNLSGLTWGKIRYERWFQCIPGARATLSVLANYGGTRWDTLEKVVDSPDSAQWTPKEIELHPPGGHFGLTQFRVVAFGCCANTLDYFGFDDFALLANQMNPAAIPSPGAVAPKSLELRLTTANPSVGLAAFEYALPAAGVVRLDLYRVDGSLVRRLLEQEMSPGVHQATWDGKDDSRHRVAAGVYFARISTASESRTQRLVLAR